MKQRMLVAMLGASLTVAPAAWADGGDTSLIHACVSKTLGLVRIVRPSQHCHHTETSMHWPAQVAASSGGGPRGVQLFESDGSFTVPAGVTSVLLEMWGGGGAAGLSTGQPGGAGGGGSYLRTVVSVTPGQAIPVSIGQGGAATCGVDGGAGGDTTFGTLVMAGGGQGGTAAGQAGAGGSASPGGISIPGTVGFATGGFSVQGSFAVPARRAPGRGGFFSVAPASCSISQIDGAMGGAGQLIVQW